MELKTPEEINSKVKELLEKGCNVVGMTTVEFIGKKITPALNPVPIDPSQNSKDYRKSQISGLYEFTSAGLQKFRNSAYIRFDRPHIVSRTKDEIVMSVSGWRFDLQGGINSLPDQKTINLNVREAEQRMNIEANMRTDSQKSKWEDTKKKAYLESKLADHMIRLRKFYMEMALTGAQSRVIVKLLGLKPQYTIDEIKRPFYVLAAIPEVDMKDATRAMIGMDDLYPAPADAYPTTIDVGEDIQKEVDRLLEEETPPPPAKALPFGELSRVEKANAIRKILADKQLPAEYPLEQMSSTELMRLYEKLTD